jgi:micrococcal nuclease
MGFISAPFTLRSAKGLCSRAIAPHARTKCCSGASLFQMTARSGGAEPRCFRCAILNHPSVYRALLVAAAVLGVPALSPARQASTVEGEAEAVDGQTLLVDGHRVRIRALHAPEVDEPGGAAAKEMAALVVYGEHVVCTVVDVDRFGRLVADCLMSSDGADFAEVMIRAGHADHCPAHGRPDLGSLPDSGFKLPADCR